MIFFAILCALLIEQSRPLPRNNPVHGLVQTWVRYVHRNFDVGQSTNGWLIWSMTVLAPTFFCILIYWFLRWSFDDYLGKFFATLGSIAVLYCTLGFRQFSHHFTEIRSALQDGNEDRARELLAHWQRVDANDLPRSEIVRHVIEYSMLAAHRHVFGVLTWYCLFASIGLGPAGPVLYRMTEFSLRYWKHHHQLNQHPVSDILLKTATSAWKWMDWLPARLTALSFAVVGNFEDAIEGWRYHAQHFPDDNDGLILAATAGALGIRLGGKTLKPLSLPYRFEETSTDEASHFAVVTDADLTHEQNRNKPLAENANRSENHTQQTDSAEELEYSNQSTKTPEVAHLAQVVGLVWRTVVTWMFLLVLLTLARLLG